MRAGADSKATRTASGFTLVELMIVVAIIAVIAGFAVPSLDTARSSATQPSSLQSVRALISAEEGYRAQNDGYATFDELIAGEWLNESFEPGPSIYRLRRGYQFRVVISEFDRSNYALVALPLDPSSGARSYVYVHGLATSLPQSTILYRDPPGGVLDWTPIE